MSLLSDGYTRFCATEWNKVHAKRIAASRKLLRFKFFRGDCHIHSNYSDGVSTVAQIKEGADKAGLDFVFITDHDTTDQQYACRKFRRVWWGQEPADGIHHLGILGTDKTFTPTGNIVDDYLAARTSPGALTFAAHPCGFFLGPTYTAAHTDLVAKLPDPIHMEIVNGANQFFDPWDITDAESVRLWDKLLSKGRIVYGLGSSDAHMFHGIGATWTGVLSKRCDKRSILRALSLGRCFVSTGPVINVTSGRAGMGQIIGSGRGSAVEFSIAAADSGGIHYVRLIKNGRIVKHLDCGEKKLIRIRHRERFAGRSFYVRAEVVSLDGRQAFSNPIFVRRENS